MGVSNSATLELRLIIEKLRNRFSVPDRLEGTAWSPKVMDLPPGERFLVVAPHPDDDAVGCGGSIIKLVDAGKSVRILFLSIQEGDFTRDHRKGEIQRSLGHMGVTDHVLHETPFPSAKEASRLIAQELSSGYDAVFAPSPFENHDHHLRAFEACVQALRAGGGSPDLIMYEVWGTLMPNLLIPIQDVMERKVAAVKEHGTQCADIDYERVARGINGYRAAASALDGYAEAFMHMPASTVLKLF